MTKLSDSMNMTYHNVSKLMFPASLLLCVTLLAACATAPTNYEPLAAARAELQQAKSDDAISSGAPLVLYETEKYLTQAEAALKAGQMKAVSHNTYMAERKLQIAHATVEHKQARQRLDELNKQREQVSSQARQEESKRAKQKLELAKQQLERANREAAVAAEQARMLTSLFSRYSNAVETPRGIVIVLTNLRFNKQDGTLLDDTAQNIEPLIDYLKKRPALSVNLEGHTDSTGDSASNQKLSEERAYGIKSHLISRGISPNRITARGMGEDYPIASNSTREGRSQNRRVEVILR